MTLFSYLPFQRLERSEIDLYTFYRDFGKDLSQAEIMNVWYTDFCKVKGLRKQRRIW